MSRSRQALLLVFALVAGAGGSVAASGGVAPESAAAAPAESARWVGAARCAECHSSRRRGAQYHVWAASAHARAFADLGGAAARKLAARAHVADPPHDPACRRCHVTGAGSLAGASGAPPDSEGVGCEACHGPGSRYAPREAMEAIRDSHARAEAYGLLRSSRATCAACHDGRTHGSRALRWPADSVAIAHPVPPGLARELELEPH